jgi:hypothetical protein
VIDSNGGPLGRFNLVDAAAIALVVVLIPVGYATYLLFRPSQPVIESVTRAEVTNEERRVAGSLLTAKLKVRGSGFNPLLRARIGDTETLGFVFENPNSADVMVGPVPPGRHDLVLYDGVQEVARAREAVEIQATSGPSVRVYGWLTNLEAATAAGLKAGPATDPMAPNAFTIIALGEVQPARTRISNGDDAADLPVAEYVERAAEMLVRCDWPSGYGCAIEGRPLSQEPPITVRLPGGYVMQIEEIAPPADPQPATAIVRLDAALPMMKVGDRDAITGSRAAEVVSIGGGAAPVVTVRLGVDPSRDGWRYRGRLLVPGAPFTLTTARYIAGGTVTAVSVAP